LILLVAVSDCDGLAAERPGRESRRDFLVRYEGAHMEGAITNAVRPKVDYCTGMDLSESIRSASVGDVLYDAAATAH
jgi:hypothetical protein